MSKEQTPIEVKAIEFCEKHAHKLRAVDSHNLKSMLVDFANSRILEALEREVIEAHTQGQAFVIKQDNLKHGRYPIASIGYYENEVKSNYEK